MKILVVHNLYRQLGGEDIAANLEIDLLKKTHSVETLFFRNGKGLNAILQFMFSLWNIKSARIVKRKIKVFNPDVVHIHNWHFASGPIIIRTIKKYNIPLVLTVHNYRLLCPSAVLMHNNKLYLKSLNSQFPWGAIFLKVYRNSALQTFWISFVIWFHKRIGTWNMVDKYICLTQFSKKLFLDSKFGIEENRFFIKPNFTQQTNVDVSIERENHFLFVGRLSEEKGVKVLLKAFIGTVHSLKIAGNGPLLNFVEQTAFDNKNIEFLGILPKQQVALELQKAKALIFPSICFETFGLTIIEAFSNRCFVIASDIGAPTSIVIDNKNGFHFEAGNIDDLKHKIEAATLLTPNKDKQIRNCAYNTYLNLYSSEKQFKYFDTLYSLKPKI